MLRGEFKGVDLVLAFVEEVNVYKTCEGLPPSSLMADITNQSQDL